MINPTVENVFYTIYNPTNPLANVAWLKTNAPRITIKETFRLVDSAIKFREMIKTEGIDVACQLYFNELQDKQTQNLIRFITDEVSSGRFF